MDYFVPEKLPQPENYLESLVWDREKDIDRMRERFQLARALSQAKVAEAKYPRRNLIDLINSKVGDGDVDDENEYDDDDDDDDDGNDDGNDDDNDNDDVFTNQSINL